MWNPAPLHCATTKHAILVSAQSRPSMRHPRRLLGVLPAERTPGCGMQRHIRAQRLEASRYGRSLGPRRRSLFKGRAYPYSASRCACRIQTNVKKATHSRAGSCPPAAPQKLSAGEEQLWIQSHCNSCRKFCQTDKDKDRVPLGERPPSPGSFELFAQTTTRGRLTPRDRQRTSSCRSRSDPLRRQDQTERQPSTVEQDARP